MSLPPSTRIASYEVLSLVGAGGMGEVYKARDAKLNRDVALKVLPDSVRGDAERTARFAREAQVLASLNHPNIAQIYGFEETDTASALVMEFVDGETLADRLQRGPLAIDDALAIARPILSALESAHAQGIVHRDLKPANIKVSDNGAVKVLDFGLAKAIDDPIASGSSASVMANSPTITSPAMTMRGVILGTAAYMSPEQAKGKPVDRRADMWAFGCVLFEMLTARRAFEGDDVAETLAAVLTKPPDWSALPPTMPAAVRQLLQRCLDRDVQRRVPDASAARWLLDDAAAVSAPVARRSSASIALASAAAIVAVLAGGYWIGLRTGIDDSVSEPLRRLSVNVGADVSLLPVTNVGGISRGVGSSIAITPDGQKLVFAARDSANSLGSRLYIRPLSELNAQPIAGTEGAAGPFLSPRGDWIAFFADGKLKKVPIGGGTAITLCEVAAGRGGTWTDNDVIVFTPSPNPGSSLMRVPASGGAPQQLTRLGAGEAVHRWAHALPGDAGILFTISTSNTGPYDEASLAVVRLSGGAPKVVLKGASFGRYVKSGHLLYANRGTMFAVPFDLATLSTRGDAVPVVEQVSYGNDNGGAQFAVSDEGTLAYVVGAVGGTERNMSWINRAGTASPLGDRRFNWNSMRFSPDGRTLLLSAGRFQPSGSGNELWTLDWERDSFKRLTFGGGAENLYGEWSPDGDSVLFVSNRAADHVRNIYWQRADGSRDAIQLTASPDSKGRLSFHPSGKYIAFASARLETASDISVMPVEWTASGIKVGAPVPFVNTRASEDNPVFSPDGKWLAYVSDETGRPEIYVRPFPGPGGKWQVSVSGGSSPQWSRSRQELVFVAPDRSLMVSPYSVPGAAFNADQPRAWADKPIVISTRGFALHPDGTRIAVEANFEAQNVQLREVTLVMPFLKELARLAPPK